MKLTETKTTAVRAQEYILTKWHRHEIYVHISKKQIKIDK